MCTGDRLEGLEHGGIREQQPRTGERASPRASYRRSPITAAIYLLTLLAVESRQGAAAMAAIPPLLIFTLVASPVALLTGFIAAYMPFSAWYSSRICAVCT